MRNGFLVSFGFAEAILHSLFIIVFLKQLFVDFFLGNDAFVFPGFELLDDVAGTCGELALGFVEGRTGCGDFCAKVGEGVGEGGKFLIDFLG